MAQPEGVAGSEDHKNAIARLRNLGQLGKNFRVSLIPSCIQLRARLFLLVGHREKCVIKILMIGQQTRRVIHIRQHQMDPNLVKAYATDFCGVKTLREATREQVENFVQHLADWADKDRNALLCQLDSYLGQKEGAA